MPNLSAITYGTARTESTRDRHGPRGWIPIFLPPFRRLSCCSSDDWSKSSHERVARVGVPLVAAVQALGIGAYVIRRDSSSGQRSVVCCDRRHRLDRRYLEKLVLGRCPVADSVSPAHRDVSDPRSSTARLRSGQRLRLGLLGLGFAEYALVAARVASRAISSARLRLRWVRRLLDVGLRSAASLWAWAAAIGVLTHLLPRAMR